LALRVAGGGTFLRAKPGETKRGFPSFHRDLTAAERQQDGIVTINYNLDDLDSIPRFFLFFFDGKLTTLPSLTNAKECSPLATSPVVWKRLLNTCVESMHTPSSVNYHGSFAASQTSTND
jgi:hypothetical protein